MDEDEYSAEIHEQILAYGLKPVQISADVSLTGIYKKEGAWREQDKVVVVKSITEQGVDPLKDICNQVQEIVDDQLDVGAPRAFSSGPAVCYLLLLAPSVSSQMEIYVQEGHDVKVPNSRVYPILADLEEERLVYRELSFSERMYIGKAEEAAEKIFQLH